MSVNLQYNYAVIDAETGRCRSVLTSSYEVPLDTYILIPECSNDYYNKYYNSVDGMWYHDAAFSDLWEECPSHNV